MWSTTANYASHNMWLIFLNQQFNNGTGPTQSMIFWLKSFNSPGHQVYTVGEINTYPLGIQTVQIITSGFSMTNIMQLMGTDHMHPSYRVCVLV